MRFFDTHIHLNDFENGAEEVVEKALACGIDKMINVSAVQSDWAKVAVLSKKYENNIDVSNSSTNVTNFQDMCSNAFLDYCLKKES